MRQKRRKSAADFKAKVALEAVKEQLTTAEIAKKFSVSPNQVTKRKREFISNSSQAFDGDDLEALENICKRNPQKTNCQKTM